MQKLVDHEIRSLCPGPRAGDRVVVGLLVLELGHERVALDVGGAVKHAAHVPQVHDVHGSVVRRQRVRVYLGVRPLESMNPEDVSVLVDALLAVPAGGDHVQSEEQPRADGVEVAVQSVPLVLILVPAALEIHGAADGDQKDGQEEDPDAESGLRRRHFRGG